MGFEPTLFYLRNRGPGPLDDNDIELSDVLDRNFETCTGNDPVSQGLQSWAQPLYQHVIKLIGRLILCD